MECSAWCIVAKHLGVKFGQFLYFSDVVDNKDWSLYDKDYRYDLKDKMTILSYEIAQEIKQ